MPTTGRKGGPKRASLNPKNFSRGGFLDDIDVTILRAEFGMFDYGGVGPEVTALKVTFRQEDGDEREQAYSVGNRAKIQETDDGQGLMNPEDEDAQPSVNERSKAGVFLARLSDAGFDMDKLDDEGPSALEGLRVHLKSEPMAGVRGGKDTSIVVVTRILDDEKPTGKTVKAKAGRPNGDEDEPAAGDEDDATENLISRVKSTVKKNKAPLGKAKLSQIINKQLEEDGVENKARVDLIKTLLSEKFLRGLSDHGLKYNGREVSVG